MSSLQSSLLLTLAGAVAMSSCAQSPSPGSVPMAATAHSVNPTADHLFQEINGYRRSQGAQDVHRHPGLDRLAQQHCEYMRKHRGTFSLEGPNVTHFGMEGRAQFARERFQMETFSENVAATNKAGKSETDALLDIWKYDKDHRQNLLDAWTYTGIGVVKDSDGMIFATQVFATASHSHSQLRMRERFNNF